jgi:hypothetical protein
MIIWEPLDFSDLKNSLQIKFRLGISEVVKYPARSSSYKG